MLPIPMRPQPDDFTCGPTSLQAVYGYFDLDLDLEAVIDGVHFLEEGGTLAVHLGADALRRGFRARLHSYNLQVFDPSWSGLDTEALDAALAARSRAVSAPRIRESIAAYREFLGAGGVLDLSELTPSLLRGYFERGLPVLAGLSATFLYASPRERVAGPGRLVFDPIGGDPQGHFVVLCGLDGDRVVVADPFKENPLARDHHYRVEVDRLIQAILLGVLTYDGNLLILEPEAGTR